MASIRVIGNGVVGRRVSRFIAGRDQPAGVPRDRPGTDVVVIASGGPHASLARSALQQGVGVVTVGDETDDCCRLLELAGVAENAGVPLVVGAAMSPGLSCLLVNSMLPLFVRCTEIHIAMHGTAGPACSRAYHRSLSGRSRLWRDGEIRTAPGGSGRELLWFPEPVGSKDCYLADIASPILLQRSLPSVDRISVRRSARRIDRLTARMPMLRPPHAEGNLGALRVELRGLESNGRQRTVVWGVADQIGTISAAVASVFAEAVASGELPAGLTLAGDGVCEQLHLLRRVTARGIKLQEYDGSLTR